MPECQFPNCKSFTSGLYCIGHAKMMGATKVKESKPIPVRSEKMKGEMKDYKKEAKQFLKDNPKCQVTGCTKKSEHVHHKAGRIGKNLTDKNNWLAVCQQHHTQIEKDVLWAKDNNYSISRLKKHDSLMVC